MSVHKRIIAIDIGNSRVKLASYLLPLPEERTHPIKQEAVFDFDHQFQQSDNEAAESEMRQWIGSQAEATDCYLSSVNQPQLQHLINILTRISPKLSCHVLSHITLPLTIKLQQPEKVGLDRLMATVAANRIRDHQQPAVIIDVGSAITIDWLSDAGEFLGGVIFPGIAMSAQAMHQQTDQLPLIEMSQLSSPPKVLGTDTESAMRSGLYYSAVGAMRETIARLSAHFEQSPLVILTGGAAPAVAKQLGDGCRFSPNLILDGIALSADCLE